MSHLFTRRRALAALVFLIVLLWLYSLDPVYAWIYAAGVGLILSAYLTNESRLDLLALHEEKIANGRWAQALARATREGIRGTIHIGYILAGLAALDLLPREIIVPLLMYGTVAMILNSAIDVLTRPYLYLTRYGEPDLEDPHHHAE